MIRRLAALFAAVMFLVVAAASPALAHGELVASSPAVGETVGSAAHIDLIFSTKLSDWVVTVQGPNGQVAGQAVQKADPYLSFEVTPPLSEVGQYIVRYSGLDTDGDLVEGAYAFSFETGGPSPAPLPVDLSVLQANDGGWWFYVALMAGITVIAVLAGLLVEKMRRLRQGV